jgi:hypothetical protein
MIVQLNTGSFGQMQPHKSEIAGHAFYWWTFRVLVWNDGKFEPLFLSSQELDAFPNWQNAYELGLLTEQDVVAIHERYIAENGTFLTDMTSLSR